MVVTEETVARRICNARHAGNPEGTAGTAIPSVAKNRVPGHCLLNQPDGQNLSDRYQIREIYIQGWYELDGDKLLQATREDFRFEDPAEPASVHREDLVAYMQRWDKWTRSVGARNQWKLTDEVRQDRNGILTDWEWWELIGTDLCGAALVKTRNDGVFLERITYFDRKTCRHRNARDGFQPWRPG